MIRILADYEPVAQSTPLRSVIAKGMLQSKFGCSFFMGKLERLTVLGGITKRMQLTQPDDFDGSAQHFVF